MTGEVVDGRYRILEVIGEGGMATVYRAEELGADREVALKVLKPRLVGDPDIEGRFQREAQLAKTLQHPGCVVVHQYGRSEAGPWIAMELLTGETVRERLDRETALPFVDAARIARSVCGPLAEAHRRGIIHRDLKPENVYLAQIDGLERVKVVDFGLAKPLTNHGPEVYRTQIGSRGPGFAGTLLYMPPEMGGRGEVGPAADLYSLGVILYEMVAGYPPFYSSDLLRIIQMHMDQPPPELAKDVPPGLARLILALLEKDPANRPQSAERVAAELRKLESSLKSGARVRRMDPTVTQTLDIPEGLLAAQDDPALEDALTAVIPTPRPGPRIHLRGERATPAHLVARSDTRPDTRPDARPAARRRRWMYRLVRILAILLAMAAVAFAVYKLRHRQVDPGAPRGEGAMSEPDAVHQPSGVTLQSIPARWCTPRPSFSALTRYVPVAWRLASGSSPCFFRRSSTT